MSRYRPTINDKRIVPIGLDDTNRFIQEHHRYMGRLHRARFCLAAYNDGLLVGVVATNNPTNNKVDDGLTLEIARLCTHLAPYGTASALISRVCRAARAMGFRRVITYLDANQDGASYKSCNFIAGTKFRRRPWKGRLTCHDSNTTHTVRRMQIDL